MVRVRKAGARLTDQIATCRGCGVTFQVPYGNAGQFCTRLCYVDPTRAQRSRNAPKRSPHQVIYTFAPRPAGLVALSLLGGVVR